MTISPYARRGEGLAWPQRRGWVRGITGADEGRGRRMNAQDAQNLLATYGIVAIGIYFLPTIVAALRGHLSSGAIFVLNLLLGWTALFWIIALVWSFTGNTRANLRAVGRGQDDPPRPKPLDFVSPPRRRS